MLGMARTRSFDKSHWEYVPGLHRGMHHFSTWAGNVVQHWQQETPYLPLPPFLSNSQSTNNQLVHLQIIRKVPSLRLRPRNLVIEAGFPPGVLQFISGPGKTGALLAAHMGIQSFTGSIAQKLALDSNMKKVTLELEGKSLAMVFEDADIANAVGPYARKYSEVK